MTVSPQTLPVMAEAVLWMRQQGFKVRGGPAGGVEWGDDAGAIYLQQMFKIANFYLENPEYEPDGSFKTSLDLLAQNSTPEDFRWCGCGKSVSCLDADGEEYPCYMFLPFSDENKGQDKLRLSEAEAALDCKGALLAPECAKCDIRPICRHCYGMNYSQNIPLAAGDTQNCIFNMIEASVSAWMLSAMFEKGNKYPFIRSLSETTISDMRRGIQVIDKAIPLDLLHAKINGDIKGLGLPKCSLDGG